MAHVSVATRRTVIAPKNPAHTGILNLPFHRAYRSNSQVSYKSVKSEVVWVSEWSLIHLQIL